MKRWAVAHPLLCCALSAACWYAVLLATRSALAAAVVPVAAAWAIGWWRETGLRWQRPGRAWLFALPPLVAGLLVGQHVLAMAVTATGVEVARGFGQYTVRRFGPWRTAAIVTPLLAGADLVVLPHQWPAVAFAVATSGCLTALRWRINTIWPLVPVHAALLGAAAPAWPALAAGIGAYGIWLLWRFPVVRMLDRPTVRILCLDHSDRLLLIGWHDPADGTRAWDVPGGGIEPGETPLSAARRELHEETGLPPECVLDRHLWVTRDSYWNNTRFRGPERYFLARVHRPPALDRTGLEPHEEALIREFRWVGPDEATSLPGRVQLPTLQRVAGRLTGSDIHRRPDGRCR